MTILRMDYETYCDLSLPKVGLDVYSQHPSCEALMLAYQFDDGPVLMWDRFEDGPDLPPDVVDALEDPAVQKWAFNAQFERTITRRLFNIDTPYENWRCTQALAYMHSFVGGLEQVGAQMNLGPSFLKQAAAGKALIKIFSMPQRVTKKNPHRRRDANTDPDLWQEFRGYCRQDVVSERAITEKLLRYPVLPFEWRLYEIDQEINDRGKPVDVKFVENAISMARRRKGELVQMLREKTGLSNPNSTQQFLPWIREHGYPFTDLKKNSVSKALKENAIEEAKEDGNGGFLTKRAVRALKIRQWSARLSTSKHATLLKAMCPNDRVMRFLYQFAGASRTNRWAGRKVQTQNLARPAKIIEEEDRLEVATAIIRSGNYDLLELFAAEPMEIIVGTVRSAFATEEDEEFVVCDLSSIESVVIGYLAGCERILQVFRDGKDVYRDFGQVWFKKTYDEITKGERSISKPAVLGAGYRLSGGKLDDQGRRTGLWGYAESMGIEMTREEAEDSVRVFREDYAPEIVQMWKDYENAARYVLKTHKPKKVGPVTFKWHKPYLVIELPSGRHMRYYKPKIQKQRVKSDRMIERRKPDGTVEYVAETYTRESLTYMGVSQITKRWQRIATHGGKITENVVQAFARDVLAVGIRRAHDKGFDIRGHVHDEIITLRKKGDERYNLEALRRCMTRPIKWAPGLPLGGAGWVGRFYKKD